MTTRDQLIYRMQEIYALQRDLLALLDTMRHESQVAELQQVLQHQHDITHAQLEPLERALNVLGAQYKMEHSPFVPVYKEVIARFKHQMNPSREQLDIYTLLLLLASCVSLLTLIKATSNSHGHSASRMSSPCCVRICSGTCRGWRNWRRWRRS